METVRSGIRLVGSTVAHAAVGVGAGSVAAVSTVLPSAGGAVDVIAVKQPDGTLRCSPFYVRFGKYQGLIRGREKVVTVTVNGELSEFTMRLGRNGKAFFVEPWARATATATTARRRRRRDPRETPPRLRRLRGRRRRRRRRRRGGEPGAADDERAPVAVALQPTESGGVSVAIVTSARAGDRDATAGAEGKKPPREAPDTASEISPPPTTRAPAREAESAWSWLAWSSFSTSSAPAETPSSASPRERSDPPAEALAAAPGGGGGDDRVAARRFDSSRPRAVATEKLPRVSLPPPPPAVSRSSSVSDGGVDSAPPPSAAAASPRVGASSATRAVALRRRFRRFDDHRVPRAAFLADPAAFAEDPALAVSRSPTPRAGEAAAAAAPLARGGAARARAPLAFRRRPRELERLPAGGGRGGPRESGRLTPKDGFETDSREASQHGASCFSPDSLASGGAPGPGRAAAGEGAGGGRGRRAPTRTRRRGDEPSAGARARGLPWGLGLAAPRVSQERDARGGSDRPPGFASREERAFVCVFVARVGAAGGAVARVPVGLGR